LHGVEEVSAAMACRVCAGETQFFFSKQILGKYQVSYFMCRNCGHVQTEQPYWLAEAYREPAWKIDVGMADRCVWTAQTTTALARKLAIGPEEPCLDWGAGTGLFVRLCRDHGLNCFYSDRYAQNIFACGFEAEPPSQKWTLVTAFEVAEHLPNPMEDFGELLKLGPKYLLFSTLLFERQGADWWYFTNNGQHVAFYTRRSLEVIAQKFGYQLASNDCDLHLFSRERVKNNVLDWARKHREAQAAKYRKKFGSRILADFEKMQASLTP
jgi:hypothetical protein